MQIEKNFRVDISGYLFLYEALAAGWVSSPWVRHYVSLTGTLLSYATTPKNIESPVTPCTRLSVEVSTLSCLCALPFDMPINDDADLTPALLPGNHVKHKRMFALHRGV